MNDQLSINGSIKDNLFNKLNLLKKKPIKDIKAIIPKIYRVNIHNGHA